MPPANSARKMKNTMAMYYRGRREVDAAARTADGRSNHRHTCVCGPTHQNKDDAVELLLARSTKDPEQRDHHYGRSHRDEQVGPHQEDVVLHRLHDDPVLELQPHADAEQCQTAGLRVARGGEEGGREVQVALWALPPRAAAHQEEELQNDEGDLEEEVGFTVLPHRAH